VEGENEDFDSAPPPFFEPPASEPLVELPTTISELLDLFVSSSFETFAKTMRAIN